MPRASLDGKRRLVPKDWVIVKIGWRKSVLTEGRVDVVARETIEWLDRVFSKPGSEKYTVRLRVVGHHAVVDRLIERIRKAGYVAERKTSARQMVHVRKKPAFYMTG